MIHKITSYCVTKCLAFFTAFTSLFMQRSCNNGLPFGPEVRSSKHCRQHSFDD